jgi:hypothetical protein
MDPELLDSGPGISDGSSFAVRRGYLSCGIDRGSCNRPICRELLTKRIEVYEKSAKEIVHISPQKPVWIDSSEVGFSNRVLDVKRAPIIRVSESFGIELRKNEIEAVDHF